jgi:DNA-directed RNA polymerase specialized sigma24 family protein
VVTHGRSLRIPSGAAGLVAALAARERGDDGPLEIWCKEGFPLLRAALLDWLPDGDEATDLAGAVMTRAYLAVKAETEVRDELPWLARLARNLRVDAWREERWASRFTSLSLSLSLGVALTMLRERPRTPCR